MQFEVDERLSCVDELQQRLEEAETVCANVWLGGGMIELILCLLLRSKSPLKARLLRSRRSFQSLK